MKTVKEFLEEKVNSKAEKALDDIMNSEGGGRLGVAMNDGDEREAEKVLKQAGLKGNMLKSVMFIMFDGM